MKKILLISLIALAFTACEGPMGPRGPQGAQGEPGYGTNWYNGSITINNWERIGGVNALNSFYYAEIDLPELTRDVFDYGTVLVYIENPANVKRVLPYVLHVGSEEPGGEHLWTETYDFDYFEGGLGVYITSSDFNTQYVPQATTYHIVLMW